MSDDHDFPTTQWPVCEVRRGRPGGAYLIVLEGGPPGGSHRLSAHECVIGRYADADVSIRHDGVSRRHAAVGGVGTDRVTLTDLGSTNGTFVNGVRIAEHVLEDGDLVQIGPHTVLKFRVQDAVEEESLRQLRELATRDALTGLLNRRGFQERVQSEFSYARRHGRPLSVFLFDLDHFKSVNDRFGHAAGDEVLREVTRRLSALLRCEDHFARYGGEEFAIVARDLEEPHALVKADRLRAAVAETPVPHEGRELAVTISLGIATFRPGSFVDADALVCHADMQLYRAKRGGRNCVAA